MSAVEKAKKDFRDNEEAMQDRVIANYVWAMRKNIGPGAFKELSVEFQTLTDNGVATFTISFPNHHDIEAIVSRYVRRYGSSEHIEYECEYNVSAKGIGPLKSCIEALIKAERP